MRLPLVSTLMATNRPTMCDEARRRLLYQDYENVVPQVLPGEGTHGAKMDWLFQRCIGDFGVIWDDDDEYAPDRISKLVAPMIADEKINAVGTSLIYYVDERIGKAWLYDNAKLPKSMFWMGAPAYRKRAYAEFGPWQDLKCGADLHFLRKLPRESVLDLRDPNLMVCRIHGQNAASKTPAPNGEKNPVWQEVSLEQLPAFYRKEKPSVDPRWIRDRMRGGEAIA